LRVPDRSARRCLLNATSLPSRCPLGIAAELGSGAVPVPCYRMPVTSIDLPARVAEKASFQSL